MRGSHSLANYGPLNPNVFRTTGLSHSSLWLGNYKRDWSTVFFWTICSSKMSSPLLSLVFDQAAQLKRP